MPVQGDCVRLYGWLCSRHSMAWLHSRLVMQHISGERIRGVVRCGQLHPAEHRCLMTALLMSADTWWMRPYGQTACSSHAHTSLLAFSRGKETITHLRALEQQVEDVTFYHPAEILHFSCTVQKGLAQSVVAFSLHYLQINKRSHAA